MRQCLVLAVLLSSCATASPQTHASCNRDYAALQRAELDTIDRGMSVYAQVREQDYTAEQRALVERTQALLDSRSRIADELDLRIVDRAREILHSDTVWDRQDDRRCEDGDTRFSLYCALYFSSREVVGAYVHRRTALEEVRRALDEATAGRPYEHRLRDFNNDPRTRLSDIHAVMAAARARLEQRLADQRACRI